MDLTIIIPTHNRLWCLPQTIKSCVSSRYQIEVIVIDDGSTDGTADWLAQQKGIIVLKQDHSGKCPAVNKGFEMARGKYIRFLDSDDQLAKSANDEELDIAEQFSADLVVSGYQTFNNAGEILYRQSWITGDDFIAQQLGESDGSHYSAFLFKKTFIAGIRHCPEFALRDDRLFILEVALKGPTIATHNGTALLHRIQHKDRLQITTGPDHRAQNDQHLKLYQLILNRLAANNNLTKRRINAALKILWPLTHWIAKYNITKAAEVYHWLLELDADFKIPEKGLIGLSYQHLGFKKTEQLLTIRRKVKYGWR